MAVQEAAQEAYQAPITQPSQNRPIEAPDRSITLRPDLITLCDQLPAAEEYIPNATLVRYVHIWTGTLEGVVVGADDLGSVGCHFLSTL